MTASRDRRDAAKNLGVALQVKYREMLNAQASGDGDLIVAATLPVADLMNSNIEFVIWVLKEYGGMSQRPPERVSKRPATNPLPKMPEAFSSMPEPKAAKAGVCNCGADEDSVKTGHRSSCPAKQHLILSGE